jgi:hypothetical protein
MAEDVAVRGDAAKRGISIVKASKAFQALLDAHKVKEPKIIAAVAKKEGVGDPDSIINAHIKNVEKWTKIYARIGDDPDKFAKALWGEVFSKLDPENM